jgi:hypothetical protein
MSERRFIVFVHTGCHDTVRGCVEETLRINGGPFLYGHHQLDIPEFRQWNVERYTVEVCEKSGVPLPETPISDMIEQTGMRACDWFEERRLERSFPSAPPRDGYPHLSWCYVNGLDGENPSPADAVKFMLENDPTVYLMVWVSWPHPQLIELLDMLDVTFPQRFIVVCHKRNSVKSEYPEALEHERVLWNRAHLGYFSGCGLADTRLGEFCVEHGLRRPYLLTLHSHVTWPDFQRVLHEANLLLDSGELVTPFNVKGLQE